MCRKIVFWLAISLLSIASVSGQKKSLKIYGAVSINDSTYMKSTEVSVKDWIEFVVNNNFDTTLFPTKDGVSEIMLKIFEDLGNNQGLKYLHFVSKASIQYNYYRLLTITPTSVLKAAFKSDTTDISLNIPITGISFEQALKFCLWKEGVLNATKAVKIKLSLPPISVYKTVIPNTDSLNRKKCALFNWALCNCLTVVNKKHNRAQGKCLLRIDSYWPSDLGLYNLQGNAAEMTSTRGIAMGGSFRHTARESYNDKSQEYKRPEDWLGFRYIVTVK